MAKDREERKDRFVERDPRRAFDMVELPESQRADVVDEREGEGGEPDDNNDDQ